MFIAAKELILHFPSHDKLRLALTSGALPEKVWAAPAMAGFEEPGHVWVRPSAALSSSARTELSRLGVQFRKTADIPLGQEVSCWLQLLPLQRDPAGVVQSDKTPILFEMPEAQLPEIVGEILRLGNDRQSFRWLSDGADSRALLRVVGPPYYSLLRALDFGGPDIAVRPNLPDNPVPPSLPDRDVRPTIAFRERAPRVWIQLGYSHSLIELIQPPAGKIVLMRPPRQWTYLDEGKFRDIYEIIEFTLPQTPIGWQDTELPRRLTVPVRLTRGGSQDVAELWVLRDRPIEQLDALVSSADDHLATRLAFAIAEKEGRQIAVLRVRPSKLLPPVLVLDGIGFRSYLKLPNLFLPCDTRLHPPLRRDAVNKLLAGDPQQITWLYPHADGSFTPESLPDVAFRPLADWVDYLLDHEHQALEAWVQATRFDFEPFICRDDQPDTPKKPPRKEGESRKGEDIEFEEVELDPVEALKPVEKSRRKKAEAFAEALPSLPPNELQERLHELEKTFLDSPAPLDAAERRPLWREMARLNAALKNTGDATLCWVNALWEGDDAEADGLAAWFQTERLTAPQRDITGPELDRLLAQEVPPTASLRALAAALANAIHAKPSVELVKRLGPAQHFLEKHEKQLPIRAIWLAWCGIVKLSAGDVLALARCRDRLLERLYQQGLSSDVDLPGFLRFSGIRSGERFRVIREHLLRLRKMAQDWLPRDTLNTARTSGYVDLIFAYGLARLGEATECRKLLQGCTEALAHRDEVHT